MILPDYKLQEWAQEHMTPFDPECINPASIDLRIARQIVNLHDNSERQFETLELKPGDLVLASTVEYIEMPDDCAGVLYLKSSLARQGLDHALAGFVDPGFCGTLTLELHAHRQIQLMAYQRIIQLVMYRMEGPAEDPYRGRYQNQVGPTRSR